MENRHGLTNPRKNPSGNTDSDEPDISEPVSILAGHPDVPDDDVHPIISVGIQKPNGEWRGIQFGFVHPDELEYEPDNTETAFNTNREGIGYYFAPTPELGVSLFLIACEVSGFEESEVFGRLRSPTTYLDSEDLSPIAEELSQSALDAYSEWQESLTMRDRRLRHLDIGEPRRNNPLIDQHYKNGEFQSIDQFSSSQERYIRKVISAIPSDELHPQRCYQNCINIIAELGYPDRVSYVEGVFLPKQAGRVTTHAWLLVDGSPIEPTMPWHYPYESESVYFGEVVPKQTVKDAIEYAKENEGRMKTPLSADDETRSILRNDPGKPDV